MPHDSALYDGKARVDTRFAALPPHHRGWHKTPMREPIRVARLWAVMAVATVYAVEVGGEVGPANLPPVRGPLSRLRRGLLWAWSARQNREPMPTGTIRHHDWPATTTTADVLLEPYVHES